MSKNTIEEQIKDHNKGIEKKIAEQKALIIPENEALGFAVPLSLAGVAVRPRKETASKKTGNDKSLLVIGLDGGVLTTNALFNKLTNSWSKDNDARQSIIENYITSDFTSGTISIDSALFMEPDLVAELPSLQDVILESQDKARTYDSDQCATDLSGIFNTQVNTPRPGIGPIGFIASYNYHTAESIHSEAAIQKATNRINDIFTRAGLGNHISAERGARRKIAFKFDALEHENVIKLLHDHKFDFAPIVQDALEEAEKERRDNMGFFARGLEDFEKYLLG